MTRKTALKILKKKKLLELSKRLRIYLFLGLIGLLIIISGYIYANYFRADNLDTPNATNEFTIVNVDAVQLSPLINGHYQAWLESDSELYPLDKFNVNPEGTVFSLKGKILSGFQVAGRYDQIDRIFITVEPNGDQNQEPTNAIILETTEEITTEGQSVSLDFTVIDFAEMSGSFILATPSNGEGNDETSGVWFVDPSLSWLTPSLELPELPQGWVYKPWVFYEGEYALTTGSFSSTLGVDNENPHSSDSGIYMFPGEDFFKNLPFELIAPFDLGDGESYVVITIEPSFALAGLNGDVEEYSIFPLWPLQGAIPEGAKSKVLFPLEQTDIQIPNASVSISYKD